MTELLKEIDFGIIFINNIFIIGFAIMLCLIIYSIDPEMFNIASVMAWVFIFGANVLGFVNGVYFKKLS